MIDGVALLNAIEGLKIAAKIPPIIENGKYTMVVPYVELRRIIERMEADGKHNEDSGEA